MSGLIWSETVRKGCQNESLACKEFHLKYVFMSFDDFCSKLFCHQSVLLWIFYVFVLSCVCYVCARLFICALWSPAGKGLTSWLSFVVSSVSLSLSHWYPGSGVVLDCIDS